MQELISELIEKYQGRQFKEDVTEEMNKELARKAEELKAEVLKMPGVQLEMKIKERSGSDHEATFSDRQIIGAGSFNRQFVRSEQNFDGSGYIHDNRSVLGTTLAQTLSDLQTIGLLPMIDYSRAKETFPLEEREGSYLLYAAQRMIQEEDKEYAIGIINEFAGNLSKASIISPEILSKFIADRSAENIKSKWELLPFCDRALLVEMSDYDGDSLSK